MTKIWIGLPDAPKHTKAALRAADSDESYMGVMNCESMLGQFPETTLDLRSAYAPTDYFNVGGIFVVSERLKAAIEEFKVNCEWFPVNLVRRGKAYQKQQFFFCNILDGVDCIDRARGEYTFWDKPKFRDHVKKIRKLVINERKAARYDLFRLAKGGLHIVCTSDRLASRLVELEFTGFKFHEPEHWNRR